jgi:gamma-glutamylcyclotransferase (GGCT)/AIG2-like uncharacterized protein YtfP
VSPTFHLFVYGTLREPRVAAGLLGGCQQVREATVQGTLYDLGDYPALMAYGTTPIAGAVWKCPNRVLQRLDSYEGVERGVFRRIGILVDGLGCWTYVAGPALAPELLPARRLASGDWLQRA